MKVDINPGANPNPLALPDATQRDRLRVEAVAGRDNDVPAEDRRSRGTIVRGRSLAVGDIVTVHDGTEVEVLAAGRGRDCWQGGWIEGGMSHRGTFFAHQIVSVRAQGGGGR